MKSLSPIFLFRSPGPVLKIEAAGNGYWRLFVGPHGGDYFTDERDAAQAAFEKRSGFPDWDDTGFACPSELEKWQRI